MAGILDEVGAYLVAQALATDPGSLFKGLVPDGQGVPDAAICLVVLPGRRGIYTAGATGAAIERPRLRIIVRNTDSATAESTITSIYQALDKVVNTTLSGTLYQRIEATAAPSQASPIRDHKLRWYWRCDFDIMKAPS